MKKSLNIVDTSQFVTVAMVIEMVAFAVVAFMKMATSVALRDGWISSSIIDVPKLFIFLLINSIAVPVMFRRMVTGKSTVYSKILFLTILCALMGVLLALHPRQWLPDIKLPATLKNQQAEYLQYIDDFSTANPENFSIYTIDSQQPEGTPLQSFLETEELRDKLAGMLREFPVIPCPQPKDDWDDTKEMELTVRLYTQEYMHRAVPCFYYGIDSSYLNTEHEKKSVTVFWRPSEYTGGGYYIVENQYLDVVFEMLEEYRKE